MSTFDATPISASLVATEGTGRTRSETHALLYLARYRNARTRTGYGVTLGQWFRWCQQIGVEPLEATRNHIELFCRDLEMHGRKDSTIATKMNALAGYYRFAVIDGLITDNPVDHVARPKVQRVSTTLGLSRPEFADMVKAALEGPPRDQAIILLLGYNGLRVSEVCGLDIEDFSRVEGQPVIQILRKGGKRQHIPLAPRTSWQMELAMVGRTTGPMRHTFVTLSLDAGRSERDIAASVGHADTRLVSYYDRGRDSIVRNTTHSVASLIEGSL